MNCYYVKLALFIFKITSNIFNKTAKMRKFNNILNILLKFSLKETKMKAILLKQKYTSMNKIIFIGRIILLLQKHNTTETVGHTLRKTLCQYYARYSSCLCTLWT